MTSRKRQICLQWTLIQDIIGPAKLWPHKIRNLFWTKNLQHFDRLIVCAFVYVNGLNPELFFEWTELLELARYRPARNHFRAIFKYFYNGNCSRSLYAFNVTNNRYEYLDGTVRRYVNRQNRQKMVSAFLCHSASNRNKQNYHVTKFIQNASFQ